MKNITVDELKNELNQPNHNIVLVDVREPYENSEFHIGGTNIPLGKVMNMEIEDIEPHKNDKVVMYCRSGMRSMQAAMMLESAGFTNVHNLTGGVLAWQDADK